jgi:thiol-disulfide isomerase/thioredoxin
MIGQPAPPFDLEKLDGGRVALDGLKGRIVVLDFWATWCRPCIQALPLLHEVAAWAQAKGCPLTVLTVNSWEMPDAAANDPQQRRDQVQQFWDRHGFTLPVLLDHDDSDRRGVRRAGHPHHHHHPARRHHPHPAHRRAEYGESQAGHPRRLRRN